jgi:hypothetical protein
MTFEYYQGTATDKELGILVRQTRLTDTLTLFLDIVALPSGRTWSFPVESEQALRPYESKQGSGVHMFEVAYRLPLVALTPIVDELASLKAEEGISLTRDQWLEEVRQGVFALIAAGGTYLKTVPDLAVSFQP